MAHPFGTSQRGSRGRQRPFWGVLAATLAGLAPGLVHAADRDGDGISNKDDACPDQAEDMDGYRDADGCADPSTQVRIRFQDLQGQPVPGVSSELRGAGGEGLGAGDWTVSVHHGTYQLKATAHGFRPHAGKVVVPEGTDFDVLIELEALMGQLVVQVGDEAGAKLPEATVRIGDAAPVSGRAGMLEQTLKPGDYIVRVQAPGFREHVQVAKVTPDNTLQVAALLEPLVRDLDRDGVRDADDACIEVPEDKDDFEDTDGCPDPTVETTVRMVDELGRKVPGVDVRVMGEGGDGKGGDLFTLPLHPGSYEVFATAPYFDKLDQRFAVPEGVEAHEVRFTMERVWTTFILYVMDDQGAPIDQFTWQLDNGERSPGDGGGVYAGKMDPGAHVLTVSAENFAPAKAAIMLEPRTFAETSITLYPTLIQVTPEKIEIGDKVYFETGKASIKPESLPLLDQVAAVLLARTDMLRVRVEGHTDSRGSAESNRSLSDKRAASVRAYLVEQGVAPERLGSVGMGEDQPIDDRAEAEAWERNRRVEFVIEEWADIKIEQEIAPREAEVEVKTTIERPPVWEGFGTPDIPE